MVVVHYDRPYGCRAPMVVVHAQPTCVPLLTPMPGLVRVRVPQLAADRSELDVVQGSAERAQAPSLVALPLADPCARRAARHRARALPCRSQDCHRAWCHRRPSAALALVAWQRPSLGSAPSRRLAKRWLPGACDGRLCGGRFADPPHASRRSHGARACPTE